MSLIPGYENDVFISYCTVDNQPEDQSKGWVDILHERLETRLSQLLGERPKIYRDTKFPIGAVPTDKNLSTSATFVCVLSPAYVNSNWCLNELKQFYDLASQREGVVIGDTSRIFKVLKTPVPYRSHPSILANFLGYEFYKIDPSGMARELNTQSGPGFDARYWEKFEDLSRDLKQVIEHLRFPGPQHDQPTVPPAPNVHEIATQPELSRPLRVFLCHSSADKTVVRDLYDRLRSDGIDPWLDDENILAGQRWELEIPKAVRTCDLVLVCLSKSSVNKRGYVQREIKIALDEADNQPEDSIFLIPLRLEDCDVPERLRSYQWVNIYEDRGYEKLMRSLRARSSTLSVTGGISH